MAAAGRPDVILLDIMMPEMDGIEVCRRLKADRETEPIPVIMISARDEEDDIVLGLDAGAQDYVTKPFNSQIVAARVRSAVRIKEAHDDLEAHVRKRTVALQAVNEHLRAGEQRYRFLADAMPAAVWTSRPDGGTDYFNKYWYDYTGVSSDEAKEENWKSAVDSEDYPKLLERWTSSLGTGEPFEFELRLWNAKQGYYCWNLARAVPMRDENGHILKWFGASIDIHDKKQTREALVRAGRVGSPRSGAHGRTRSSQRRHASRGSRARARRTGSSNRQGNRGVRQPRQRRLPRRHEPRDSHADERHPRHDPTRARYRTRPRATRLSDDGQVLRRVAFDHH